MASVEFQVFPFLTCLVFNSILLNNLSTVYQNVSKDIYDDVTNYLIVAQGAGSLMFYCVQRPSILASNGKNKCSFFLPCIGFAVFALSTIVIIILQIILLSRGGNLAATHVMILSVDLCVVPASPLVVKLLIDLKKEAEANQRIIDYCTVLNLIAPKKITSYSQISSISAEDSRLSEVNQDTKSLVDQIRNP